MTNGKLKFNLNGENLTIVFTQHARERLSEFHISIKAACRFLQQSLPEKPIHTSEYKRKKYHCNVGVTYHRCGPYIYTGKREVHKITGEPCFVVITFIDQRVTIK